MKDDPIDEGEFGGAFDPRIVRLGWALLKEVLTTGAVSLEVEPVRERYRVQLRVDGAVRASSTCATLPPDQGRAIVARFKVLAGFVARPLPIPIQGELRTSDGRRYVIATLPASRGETLSLTVVATPVAPRTLDDLGLEPDDRVLLDAALDASRGLVVVSGPADSGKRTLLHASLRRLGAGARSIVSIAAEPATDLPGVLQVVPFAEIGLTRAAALAQAERVCADAVALCDPLDEPRTALRLAEHAASHRLALTSVRAQDAAQAAMRLVVLGLDPAHLARFVTLVVGLRLVPRLCPECKVAAAPPTASDLAPLGRADLSGWQAFTPGGCPACGGTGRRGRRLAAELIPLSAGKSDVKTGSPFLAGACVREELQARRRSSLRDAALRLARGGEVALEDAVGATPPG